MSEELTVANTVLVDIAAWIEKSKADPAAYIERHPPQSRA